MELKWGAQKKSGGPQKKFFRRFAPEMGPPLSICFLRPCKVTDVGTNRQTVSDFLLVINSNGHPISYRVEVIAECCLNFGHFEFGQRSSVN